MKRKVRNNRFTLSSSLQVFCTSRRFTQARSRYRIVFAFAFTKFIDSVHYHRNYINSSADKNIFCAVFVWIEIDFQCGDDITFMKRIYYIKRNDTINGIFTDIQFMWEIMLVAYHHRNILSKQNQDTWWLIWRLSYINAFFTRICLATSIKKKIKTSCCGFLSFFAKTTVATESVFAINFLISLFTLVYLNHYFNFLWPLRIIDIVRVI